MLCANLVIHLCFLNVFPQDVYITAFYILLVMTYLPRLLLDEPLSQNHV